jgi:pimeloyl-ACP methyl ester carboxylesterase
MAEIAGLHYVEAGQGEPLLLIHGTGGNADAFQAVIGPLAERWRVIAYDRRGFSRSGPATHPKADYFRRHADDAAALLRDLGAAPANVLGWSGGGLVSLSLAVNHPDVVRRLVVYEPPLHAKGHPTLAMGLGFAKLLGLRAIGRTRDAAGSFFRMATTYSTGGNGFDRMDARMREALLDNAPGIMREIDGGTCEELTAEVLRGIRVPMRAILGGTTAPFLANATDRLTRILPALPVTRVPGTGHLMMIDHPAEFVRALSEALA